MSSTPDYGDVGPQKIKFKLGPAGLMFGVVILAIIITVIVMSVSSKNKENHDPSGDPDDKVLP